MKFLKIEKLTKEEINKIITGGLEKEQFNALTLNNHPLKLEDIQEESFSLEGRTWKWGNLTLITDPKTYPTKMGRTAQIVLAKEFSYEGKDYMLEYGIVKIASPAGEEQEILRFYNESGQVWDLMDNYKEVESDNEYSVYGFKKDMDYIFYKYFNKDEKVTNEIVLYQTSYLYQVEESKRSLIADDLDYSFALFDFIEKKTDSSEVKRSEDKRMFYPLTYSLSKYKGTQTISKSEKIFTQAMEENNDIKEYIKSVMLDHEDKGQGTLNIKSFGKDIVVATLYSLYNDVDENEYRWLKAINIFYKGEVATAYRIASDIFTSKNIHPYDDILNTYYTDPYKEETYNILSQHIGEDMVMAFAKRVRTVSELHSYINNEDLAKMLNSPIKKTIKSLYLSGEFESKANPQTLIDNYLGGKINDKPFPEGYGFTNEQLEVFDKIVMSELISYPEVFKKIYSLKRGQAKYSRYGVGRVRRDEETFEKDLTEVPLNEIKEIASVINRIAIEKMEEGFRPYAIYETISSLSNHTVKELLSGEIDMGRSAIY